DFNFNHSQRARRRAVQDSSRLGIESAVVTWTLESLVLARVIYWTREMRALLAVRVVLTAFRANQDCRIFLGWIMKVKRRVRRECFGAVDARRCNRRSLSRLQRSLGRKTRCAQEERRGGETEKVTE